MYESPIFMKTWVRKMYRAPIGVLSISFDQHDQRSGYMEKKHRQWKEQQEQKQAKQEKTTDIWFDEKDPLIHFCTHNTALKKRLATYAEQPPNVCRQADADPETGCMEFDIETDRFSFRLTAPYSEERREAARQSARKMFLIG